LRVKRRSNRSTSRRTSAAKSLIERRRLRSAGWEGVAAGIDYLVNNVGSAHLTDLESTLGILRVNIEALTDLTHRFLLNILARRGRIFNVASSASFQPEPSHGGVLRQQGLPTCCRSLRRWRPNSAAPT
jgi:NAD(P)-dependent dehydrogenase (short-subunit alcohol dehydrogenase family)